MSGNTPEKRHQDHDVCPAEVLSLLHEHLHLPQDVPTVREYAVYPAALWHDVVAFSDMLLHIVADELPQAQQKGEKVSSNVRSCQWQRDNTGHALVRVLHV